MTARSLSRFVTKNDQDAEAGPNDWLGEHRLRAVLEVRAGAAVSEVAIRYGASRQSVYAWRARYDCDGPAGLADKSRRPNTSPRRIPAEVEALICELRRSYPRWGARRVVFELAARDVAPVPARATVHRVLKLVRGAEFKRKQAAPGLKVTDRAFGTGWRMPIAARYDF